MTPTFLQKSVRVALGSGLVFLVLWWWAPSDRGTITTCLRGLVEASQGGGVFYGEYRDQLVEAEQARSITIISTSSFGGGLAVKHDYRADGEGRTIVCSV